MNPFILTGFSFLLFYVIAGIAILMLMRLCFRQMETASNSTQQNLTDPYLIAHLRAGSNEALRVATVSLLDRGLLVSTGDMISVKNAGVFGMAKRPIEQAVLQHFHHPAEAHTVFKMPAALAACETYEKALAKQGLLADAGTFAKRLLPVAVALAALIGIAWAKVNIALSQGRHNLGFLVFLALIFSGITLYMWRRRRTGQGDAMLTDLHSLFSRLKGRAKSMKPGGQTNEAALLAAVFGLSALPVAAFPFMEKLYPPKAGSGSGCGSSCSSSSSSSSSCGGGCGGGGCGG